MNRPSFESRERGLRLLADFVPRAGRAYAAQRNYDRGPADRANVSCLSPYVRHRAVAEDEILGAILAEQTPSAAFKSVQEVMWRTYWKGWLEAHPSAWSDYLEGLAAAFARIDAAPAEREAYERAVAGATGNAAFDAWVRELRERQYLHNHARMWFASLWIFTFELPWELGADFFMQNLLDGDPASNTLSWRWVAGLQTPGKTYLTTRRNVLRYTENRLDPGDAIAVTARALRAAERAPLQPLHFATDGAASTAPALLVLHDDDFGSATLPYDPAEVRSVVALSLCALRSPRGVAPGVAAFVGRLAREASAAAAEASGARDEGVLDVRDVVSAAAEVTARARARGLERIIVPYGAVGPGRMMVEALAQASRECGIATDVIVREYDAATWPRATRGFFQFAKHIPEMLAELRIGALAGQDVART